MKTTYDLERRQQQYKLIALLWLTLTISMATSHQSFQLEDDMDTGIDFQVIRTKKGTLNITCSHKNRNCCFPTTTTPQAQPTDEAEDHFLSLFRFSNQEQIHGILSLFRFSNQEQIHGMITII